MEGVIPSRKDYSNSLTIVTPNVDSETDRWDMRRRFKGTTLLYGEQYGTREGIVRAIRRCSQFGTLSQVYISTHAFAGRMKSYKGPVEREKLIYFTDFFEALIAEKQRCGRKEPFAKKIIIGGCFSFAEPKIKALDDEIKKVDVPRFLNYAEQLGTDISGCITGCAGTKATYVTFTKDRKIKIDPLSGKNPIKRFLRSVDSTLCGYSTLWIPKARIRQKFNAMRLGSTPQSGPS